MCVIESFICMGIRILVEPRPSFLSFEYLQHPMTHKAVFKVSRVHLYNFTVALAFITLWGVATKYRACFTSKHEHNWVFPALGWRLAGFWLVSHLFSVYAEEASFFGELQSINLSNYVGNMLHWFEHQLQSSKTLWLMLPPISCNILITIQTACQEHFRSELLGDL